ncbi:DUF1178 family protein [Thermodesulfobacteriota bacterium]
MIIFDLECDCGFQFEGWFQDQSEFLVQKKTGVLVCPKCGSPSIRKLLSPVAYHGKRDSMTARVPEVLDESIDDSSENRKAFKQMQQYIVKNFEDVGSELAEKALKMHYGVEEARNIRGVATRDEEKILQDEGIELLKFPLPGKENDVN